MSDENYKMRWARELKEAKRRHDSRYDHLNAWVEDEWREPVTPEDHRQLERRLQENFEMSQVVPWIPVHSIVITAMIMGLVFFVSYVLATVEIAWNQLPQIFAYGWVRVVFSLSVIGVGYFAFWIRKNFRGLYAFLELWFGGITCFRSSLELAQNQDRWGWVLAIFGSLYIVVRAFDNFEKAKEEKEKKLAKLKEEEAKAGWNEA